MDSLSRQKLPEIHRLRCPRLKAMCDMAQDLQHQEDKDHTSLEPRLQVILKGKRLRLFETLLKGIEYPDKDLVADMRRGFRLTGWLPDTETRPCKVVPPALHRDEVWAGREKGNEEIWERCRPSPDPELDKALWDQSLQETDVLQSDKVTRSDP